MALVILFGTMVVFFAIGVPIGICLIFPCFIIDDSYICLLSARELFQTITQNEKGAESK